MLVPPVSHILELAYMALLTDLCNSFYFESKFPALSSTLYLTLMVTAALFAKSKHCFNHTKIKRSNWCRYER